MFVSHAHEDKETVARPLAELLEAAGLRVWFDDNPTQIGISDRLPEKLNEGLAHSRFGLAILSRAYLSKKWTRDELDTFLMRERRGDGGEVVIPVLHDVDENALHDQYPLVSSRIWLSVSDGLDRVARSIVDVVLAKGSKSPSAESPSRRRRFLDLLDTGPDVDAVRGFLGFHPSIVTAALGMDGSPLVVRSPEFGGFRPDFCVGELQATVGRRTWRILVLGPVAGPLFEVGGDPATELGDVLDRARAMRRWAGDNLGVVREEVPGFNTEMWTTVVAGRRATLGDDEREHLAELNDLLIGANVRSYDWLVEHA